MQAANRIQFLNRMLRLSTTQSYPVNFTPAMAKPAPVQFCKFGFSTQMSTSGAIEKPMIDD